AVNEDAGSVGVVLTRDEVQHVDDVLLGAGVFLVGPSRSGLAGAIGAVHRPGTAIVGLGQAAVAERRDDDIAAFACLVHEIVGVAVVVVDAEAGAQGDEDGQALLGRPGLGDKQAVGDG